MALRPAFRSAPALDSAPLDQRAEAAAGALPPLLVEAERVAATVAQGVHGRRRVGVGESFWQFRRYEPGDSTQRIDWRQTAKTDTVFLREQEWEASQTVWLWRDASPSMDWRSDDALPTKRGRAELLLAALALLLSRAGERPVLLGGPAGIGTSAGGRVNLARLAQALEQGAAPSLPQDAGSVARHGALVLFGDFLGPVEATRRAVGAYAARGVRGHLVQVLDPAETALPFTGRVRFAGLEDEPSELVPRVEAIRDAYLARLAAHQEALRAAAAAFGWSFAVHATDRPPAALLLALHGELSGDAPAGQSG